MLKFLKNRVNEKRSLLNVYALIDAVRQESPCVYSINDLQGNNVLEKLKTLPEKKQKNLALHLVDSIEKMIIEQGKSGFFTVDEYFFIRSTAQAIQSSILRRKLNYSEDEWINLIARFKKAKTKLTKFKRHDFPLHIIPINFAIKQIEYYLKENAPSAQLIAFVEDVLEWEEFDENRVRTYSGSKMKTAAKKLRSLFPIEDQVSKFTLRTKDIGTEINQIIDQMSENKVSFNHIFRWPQEFPVLNQRRRRQLR